MCAGSCNGWGWMKMGKFPGVSSRKIIRVFGVPQTPASRSEEVGLVTLGALFCCAARVVNVGIAIAGVGGGGLAVGGGFGVFALGGVNAFGAGFGFGS